MIDNKSYIIKGTGLIICGLLIGFVPNIITYLFYGVGAAIVCLCALRLIRSIGNGKFDAMFFSCILGALIGFAVMSLPHFIKVKMPLIIGIIFAVTGASRIIRSLNDSNNRNKTAGIISAAVLVIAGLFFMMNPLKISIAVRIIIGIVIIIMGVFNLIAAYKLKQHNDNVQPDIINVDSYSIKDD